MGLELCSGAFSVSYRHRFIFALPLHYPHTELLHRALELHHGLAQACVTFLEVVPVRSWRFRFPQGSVSSSLEGEGK